MALGMVSKGNLVVGLGATIRSREGNFNFSAIRAITRQFQEFTSEGYKIVAVVGAGGTFERYLENASFYEKDQKRLDEIAIAVSRINAQLLIASLRSRAVATFPDPLSDLGNLDHNWFKDSGYGLVAVFGGLRPGLTSDSSAALIASKISCPLVIVSTSRGIYDRDPQMSKSKKLQTVDRKYLLQFLKDPPRTHVLDSQTVKILLKMPKGSLAAAVTSYKYIKRAAINWGSHQRDNSATWIRV